MQFVRTQDLKAGMRLAKPIYNKTGVLLYDRDSRLTQPIIRNVENFGLIGIYILEPAEPLPPLTEEDLEFERNQTIYMFKLRDIMVQLAGNRFPEKLLELTDDITRSYGNLKHRINFNQNLRSADDFVYKHSISSAILCTMITSWMRYDIGKQTAVVTAALLCNLGYLKVPRDLIAKDTDLSDEERAIVQKALESGFEYLHPQYNDYALPEIALKVIRQYIYSTGDPSRLPNYDASILTMASILRVADQFDQLTAMSLHRPPMSEIMAMRFLQANKNLYPSEVVNSLAHCIHIAPKGASIDLSNGNKGIILVENENDFIHPVILQLSDNQIYDLSIPAVAQELQIIDIMKTMDNRVEIDEETLKQFESDDRLSQMTRRINEKLKAKKKKLGES